MTDSAFDEHRPVRLRLHRLELDEVDRDDEVLLVGIEDPAPGTSAGGTSVVTVTTSTASDDFHGSTSTLGRLDGFDPASAGWSVARLGVVVDDVVADLGEQVAERVAAHPRLAAY